MRSWLPASKKTLSGLARLGLAFLCRSGKDPYVKRCAYCGKQYPDGTTICTIDGQVLPGSAAELRLTGTWLGSYGYPQNPELPAVPFTLKLQEDAPGHFVGTVTEDRALGMPGTGSIDGEFALPHIKFIKKMPVCYMTGENGDRITLREWLARQGLACEGDPAHPPVIYEGEFYEADQARGMWTIEAWEIPLADGMSMPMGKVSGSWMIEFGGDN